MEEIQRQNRLQVALQEKIDHLTKVILTSTSVTAGGPVTPQVRAILEKLCLQGEALIHEGAPSGCDGR